MGGKVLLIDHPAGKRDDRASQALAARGYALDWRCPGNGDSLPEPGPERALEYCAAIVYGGPESANDVESKAYIRQETDWIGRWIAECPGRVYERTARHSSAFSADFASSGLSVDVYKLD